eukprot:13716865-Ditylum_brightwellii.AAC.1
MAPIWIERWSYQYSTPFKVTLNLAHFGNAVHLLFYNHWASKPPHMNIVYTMNHGWECGTKEDDKIIKPIHPDSIKELETTVGPSSEAENIGYAVSKLSKFSSSPVHCHYKAIKWVYCYFQQTIDWGLIFWRQESRNDLPEGAHIQQALSNTDQKFIGPKKADQLAIYVDAAHATDIKQR